MALYAHLSYVLGYHTVVSVPAAMTIAQGYTITYTIRLAIKLYDIACRAQLRQLCTQGEALHV